MVAAAGDEVAAVDDEQVLDVVRAVELVDDRASSDRCPSGTVPRLCALPRLSFTGFAQTLFAPAASRISIELLTEELHRS